MLEALVTNRLGHCPWCPGPTEAEGAPCPSCWDRLSEERRIARLPAFLADDGVDHLYVDGREVP